MTLQHQEVRAGPAARDQRPVARRLAAQSLAGRASNVMLVLFIAALLLRLYRLGAQSLWLDEGSSWAQVTDKSWGRLLLELGLPNAAYPLYHLLLKGWVLLAGSSEVALRLPSALAGALAVPALYALGRRLAGGAVGLGAALLLLVSPFALWQSQDAKAYSLLICSITLALVLFWDALQHGRRHWALLPAALLLLLLHRLSALTLLGALVALQLAPLQRGAHAQLLQHRPGLRLGLRLLTLLLPLAVALGLWWSLGQVVAGPGAALAVAPGSALWLVLQDFALYKSAPALWLLSPYLLLLGWGLLLLLRDLRPGAARQAGAAFVLSLGLLPLALFLVLLLVAPNFPLYEARYLSGIYPLFLLALAWPCAARDRRLRAAAWALVALALLANGLVLLQQPHNRPAGLFSGHPVKEDFRGAMQYLADRVHPDDVVILHPTYLAPLYRYYAPRVTPDPLPEPTLMGKLGAERYEQGEFHEDLNAIFAGHTRAWLIEAPLHGIKVDPPDPRYEEDKLHMMGRLTVSFRFAYKNKKWNCAERPWRAFLGVRVLCQSFPEVSGTGEVPEPALPLQARFADLIELRGYTLNFFPGTGGRAQAGGTLPLTLYWRSTRPLQEHENYVVFLHLVRQLGEPPVAQQDIQPLEGGWPTSLWTGTPVHDEHAIPLPADLAPGHYRLLLGLFDPHVADDPSTPQVEGRLPVSTSHAPAGPDYVELGSVEVVRP